MFFHRLRNKSTASYREACIFQPSRLLGFRLDLPSSPSASFGSADLRLLPDASPIPSPLLLPDCSSSIRPSRKDRGAHTSDGPCFMESVRENHAKVWAPKVFDPVRRSCQSPSTKNPFLSPKRTAPTSPHERHHLKP